MQSKEYIELQSSMGYLIDEINELDTCIDNLDESKTDEYIEIERKIDGLYRDACEIKKDLEALD
jgi:prefoldin subunit 5